MDSHTTRKHDLASIAKGFAFPTSLTYENLVEVAGLLNSDPYGAARLIKARGSDDTEGSLLWGSVLMGKSI